MWIFAGILLSLAALLALAGLFQFRGSRADARRFPPTGQLVDIGGRRLHALVEGSGDRTVVFESGISATSLNWVLTQPEAAKSAVTCSYDRAGLGWSDAAGGPLDTERMVADLDALLEKLALPAPYVLVGHSFGGTLVRLYAQRHPEKVAGLVLVDPVLACHWAHPDAAHARLRQRGIQVSRWAAALSMFGAMRLATSQAVIKGYIVPRFAKRTGGEREKSEGIVDRLDTELRKLPPQIAPTFRAFWCRPKTLRSAADHLTALPGSFSGLTDSRVSYPIIVISAANNPPEGFEEHRAVAALSTKGEHIIAQRSGHWVQFDEPELIVEAIRRILSAST